jgi:hypothetical protein
VLDLSGVPVAATNNSYQQQQQPEGVQPEGVQLEGAAAARDAAADPSAADVELLGAWGAAQALQRPVLCPVTGYRVFPDGRWVLIV